MFSIESSELVFSVLKKQSTQRIRLQNWEGNMLSPQGIKPQELLKEMKNHLVGYSYLL